MKHPYLGYMARRKREMARKRRKGVTATILPIAQALGLLLAFYGLVVSIRIIFD